MAEPRYRDIRLTVMQTSGRMFPSVDLVYCIGCGSIVADQNAHNAWHEKAGEGRG